MSEEKQKFIRIKGAKEHNLKNINVDIPRDKLVVITGVSGSGKSSLAFDTIYAEGQRRYIESLSSYARQFLGVMEKPAVDLIEGLSPSISIEQKNTHKNPRSTVGTVTEVYDYLRLLYARVGQSHCHKCNRLVKAVSVDQIVEKALELADSLEKAQFQILAPVIRNRKGLHRDTLEGFRQDGFVRVRINGVMHRLDEGNISMDKNKQHNIDLVIDRLFIKDGIRSRLADSIELALKHGRGSVIIFDGYEGHYFSQKLYCNHCGISIPELSPRSFSFNSPTGACGSCSGLGMRLDFDENKLVADPDRTLRDSPIAGWGSTSSYWYLHTLELLEKHYDIDPDVPWCRLTGRERKIILYGSSVLDTKKKVKTSTFNEGYFEGVIPNLHRRYKETRSPEARNRMHKYMVEKTCLVCEGQRLRQTSLHVLYSKKNIIELTSMSIDNLNQWFLELNPGKYDTLIADQIYREIKNRLQFLVNVGVGYLSLARTSGTLSGGETQRLRLATQLGSSLTGVLYVLDEPSIGLHQRDNQRLLNTLLQMRNLGNSVLVVEHDEDTMLAADCILDIGPGAGVHGGEVIAIGTADEIRKSEKSITGAYLSGRKSIAIPNKRRKGNSKSIVIEGAKENNLKNLQVKFPLGNFICLTGVSGSGKSTLVNQILYSGLSTVINKSNETVGRHRVIKGVENIGRVLLVDQAPIGRTPRSNPATYTGVFTPIRELYAGLNESLSRGYEPGRFSFNVKGGRCENCEGAGIIKVEMHFLADVYVPCEVCEGKRFNTETLEVKYKGASIYDVLEMIVEEALVFFNNIPTIAKKLSVLSEVGLSYVKLGQAATTLSGGEAQRVKLALELSRLSLRETLYILDEPTTGLHFDDVARLLEVLHALVDKGNTVVTIEHNLDVIKTADYIIDLGPEGGDGGGQLIAKGTPEEVAKNPDSCTGAFLKKMLKS